MAAPDGGLITQTNQEYYTGEQIIFLAAQTDTFTCTFKRELRLVSALFIVFLCSNPFINFLTFLEI